MTVIPKGWFVHEAGQNPVHLLWYVVLMNFDDFSKGVDKIRHSYREEYDSFEEALHACIKDIEEA